jgi:hypothetical protein
MADYLSSITIDDVIDALKDFLTPFVPGGEILRAQVNRTPMAASPCVYLTELLQVDLDIPYPEFLSGDDVVAIHGGTRIDIQIDFYGASSGDYCKAVKAAFRTGYGFDQFPENIRPLYTSDGVQSPLITGEQQYESRWTLTVSLQYNPIVTIPQQFADELVPNPLIPADLL